MNRLPNTPSENNEFDYTDEDAMLATQFYWEGHLLDNKPTSKPSRAVYEYDDEEKSSGVVLDENEDDSEYKYDENDTVEEKPYEFSHLPNIGIDWEKLDAEERMRFLDAMRDSESGEYSVGDYIDDITGESSSIYDKTPDGWPDFIESDD